MRKHKIIPEKPPDPEPIIQEALIAAEQRKRENRLEDKDLDELDALEDDEDEAFLNQYRQQRLAEITNLQKSSVYGQVYPLQKVDYARDVTEASSKAFVFVNLTSSMGVNVESRILTELWRQMAVKYGEVKFCEIRADMCIEGYPDKNTPTILVYKDGDIKRQVVTLRDFRGVKTNMADLERLLVEVGAVKENDVRLKREDDHDESETKGLRVMRGKPQKDDDDDDDDDDDWE